MRVKCPACSMPTIEDREGLQYEEMLCEACHGGSANMSFTPGPWMVFKTDEFPKQVVIREWENPKGRVIAVVDDNDPQDKANAWLIAAAPTLLELLKEAVTGSQGVLSEWMEKARATINMADSPVQSNG